MKYSLTMSLFILLAVVFQIGAIEPDLQEWQGFPYPESGDSYSKEVFHYSMKGSVKLLFFWIGKDNVGGGTISRINQPSFSTTSRIDGYEVLFGSDPEAVPGKHNRWGYARELAFWESTNDSSHLTKSVFEGFMSKSSEESMVAVRKSEKNQEPSDLSLFEGAISTVTPTSASINLWGFNASNKVTYKDPTAVGIQHLETIGKREPDVVRVFDNNRGQYEQPAGFVTAIRLLLDPILEKAEMNHEISQFKNSAKNYISSARLYTLRITKVKRHKKFKLKDQTFQNVLELDFKTLRHDNKSKHSFSLWIPTNGPYRGIPVKVTDKPRWWLKVELLLDFEKMKPAVG